MPRLTNVSGTDLVLYAQQGEAGAYEVADGQTIEIPGEIVNGDDDDADFHLIGEGDNARSWPKSTWQVANQGGTPRSTTKREE
jgi:hypothetical protein